MIGLRLDVDKLAGDIIHLEADNARLRQELAEARAENERIWKRFELVIGRYMTCLEILGKQYEHPFVAAYWNELHDLVKGHLDADSECTQYWNDMKARIDAAYEKEHGG